MGLMASATAGANDALIWQWKEPVRYAMVAEVQLPETIYFNAVENIDSRITLIRIDMNVTCSNYKERGSKKWEIRCLVDDSRLMARPHPIDVGQVAGALDDYESKLTGSTVEMVFTNDGRVKSYDLIGIERNNSRMVDLEENLMMVVGRALAGLDLQLPKKGDDKGKPWRQKRVMAMAFPSTQGSMGSASVDHTVVKAEEDGVVVISSTGKGLMGSGEMIPVGNDLQPKTMYTMKFEGAARFDTINGRLISREYFVEGTPSVSSASISELGMLPYIQAVKVTLLDGDVPALGDNVELPIQ